MTNGSTTSTTDRGRSRVDISLADLFSRQRRRLVTPSGDGVRGFFPSFKTGRMVRFESLGERNAAALLEELDCVVTYREQPAREAWWDGGRLRRYTPDFRVETPLGAVLVEIKTAADARRPRLRRRHICIRLSLAERGIPFVVWTERHVRRPARARAHLLAAARRGARLNAERIAR